MSPKTVRLEGVTKSFGDEIVLGNIDLTIPGGKFFSILGPSGCGKTTILRLMAGLEKPTRGRILIGNEDITHMPINRRRVNTVFQQYALFPHMNVFENVAYGLHIKEVQESEIKKRVKTSLEAVGMDKFIYKPIQRLSGGQQQRVALARAVVNRPDVLLLDEPLAALDPNLREKVMVELVELQEELEMTFVYVTHDPFEALTVADSMAILNRDGDIEQLGTPKEIYEFPKSSFVARFIGRTNLLSGKVEKIEDRNVTIEIPGLGSFLVFVPQNKSWITESGHAVMSIRPEKILITKSKQENFSNHLVGTVHSIVYSGRATQYNVALANGSMLSVFEQNEEHFPQEVIDYDDKVNLYWQKENVVLLER